MRFAAAVAAMLMLLAPAIWNGFPLLQYDTGGYLARWYENVLEISRSPVYGFFLAALARPDLWPAVAVQAAATMWVFWLLLRAQGMARPGLLVLIVAALSLLTTLAWLASTLLTDIFAGLAVLALYLVVLRAEALARWECWVLVIFIAFAAGTHTATLAMLLALVLVGAVVAWFDRRLVPFAGLARGALALVLGTGMVLAANFWISGRITWMPGGGALLFGRMLEAGIVARYLNDHCPDPRLRLCQYRDKLPATADEFFWDDDIEIFNKLGRFEGLDQEMKTIVRESLVQYPWLQLKAAVSATALQLVQVATGFGLGTDIFNTYWVVEQYAPAAVPTMKRARQQKGELDFTVINYVQVPVAWASMLLLLGVIVVAYRRFPDVGPLAVTVALAILANAFVCGALANPHDRYGARIVWLASFVVLLALVRLRNEPKPWALAP
jgi:hypothetical protein